MNSFFYIVGGIVGGWLLTRKMTSNPEELLKVCAWCKRVWRDGAWRHETVSELVAQTHGICKECESQVYAEIEEEEGAEGQ